MDNKPETKKEKAEASKKQYWIRHQETGGVREITLGDWQKKADTLRLEGYVLVDEKGHPIDDDDVPAA